MEEQMAALGIKDTAKSSDEIMLRQAITAELDAINLYEQMAKSTSNKKLKEVFLDIAKDEKVHVWEFQEMLCRLDKEHKPAVDDGEKEVKKKSFAEFVENKNEKRR